MLTLGLLIGLPMMAGCGSLLGQRYDDFRAYYNALYNARQDFDRAERAILRADEPIDRTRFLSVFPRGQQGARGGQGQQAFETVIRRSADVLRDHPGSRWVDDALFLIGKAYFYQGNFDAAAQKFREVLVLEEGRLTDQAYLWLGRSLMESRDFGDAAAALRQGLDRPELHRRWAGHLKLAFAENDLRRGETAAAAEGLEAGLDQIEDAVIGARAAFLLGQVLDTLDDHERAHAAYQRALDFRPPPELTFAAEMQRNLALKRAGQLDEALARLDRLRRDDRFFQQRAEVELVRARALTAAGEIDEAHALLDRLLYHRDASMRIDRVRGPLHYHLAEIYRDHVGDLGRASAHFDTAATTMRQAVAAAREVMTTREAILDAERQALSYGSYARVQARVTELDSLLHLGSLDDETFAATIDAIAEQRREEALAAERERRRIEDLQGFGQTPIVGGGTLGGGDPAVAAPNGASPTGASGQPTAGFLSFRNPVRVQENLIAFQSRWGDRPHVPNWRRASAVSAAATVAAGNGGLLGPQDAPLLDPVAATFVDISAIPRTPEAREAMHSDRAVARYERGNVLFLTLNDPAAAITWYQRVIDEDGDHPVALRARYALAEIYANRGDSLAARQLYEEVSERGGDDPLAAAALERLGRSQAPLAPDSLELATRAYEAAFATWQEGEHAGALDAMLRVDRDFPLTEAAARARLAAGMIYTEWSVPDTLALIAQTPDALLDSALSDEAVAALSSSDAVEDDLADGVGDDGLADGDEAAPSAEPPDAGDVDVGDAEIETEIDDEVAVPDTGGHRASGAESSGRPEPSPAPETIDFSHELLMQQAALVEPDTLQGDIGLPEPDVPHEGPRLSWLETLYQSIEDDFPDTRFAQRARAMRLVIEEQRVAFDEALAAAQAAAEGPAPDDDPTSIDARLLSVHEAGLALFDTPDEAPVTNGDAQLDPRDEGPGEDLGGRDAAPGTVDPMSLMGDEPLDAAPGGYTWVTLQTPRQVEAQNRLVSFHNRGYRAALTMRPDDDVGQDVYLVLVGRFESEAEAEAAEGALPLGTDRARAFIVPLTTDLELTTAEDLVSP